MLTLTHPDRRVPALHIIESLRCTTRSVEIDECVENVVNQERNVESGYQQQHGRCTNDEISPCVHAVPMVDVAEESVQTGDEGDEMNPPEQRLEEESDELGFANPERHGGGEEESGSGQDDVRCLHRSYLPTMVELIDVGYGRQGVWRLILYDGGRHDDVDLSFS